MAPPLALISKECLPSVIEDCLPSIQEYAADKRAPHPVALLVKNIDVYWFGRFSRYFFLNNRKAGGKQCFSYGCGAESGEFTTESMQRLYNTNKRKRRDAQLDADSHNSRDESTKIHPFFRHMQQEMQSCRWLPGSLSSCEGRYYTPDSYPSNTWPARGWNGSKRPCKRTWCSRIYRNYRVDIPVTDSDSD